MKMSKMLNIKSVKPLVLMAFFLVFLGSKTYAIDGESVFKANCAACHKVGKDFVGPALKGAQARWEENSSIENLYKWVQNSSEVIDNGDAYAKKLFAKWNNMPMPAQAISNEEIDALFEYVESYVDPVAEAVVVEEEVKAPVETTNWLWYVIIGLLLVVIFAVSSVKNQLKKVAGDTEENLEKVGPLASVRGYLWRNFNYSFFFGFVIVITVLVAGYRGCSRNIGVFDGYKPDQPIAYSHKLHAGQLEIECVYCHNSVEKSKHAGIPTTNVCMNCHKAVSEGSTTGTEEIAKIYEAAGFDASTFKYSGETKPVNWVKVHNLPDHVYFNHSQHVVVGGLDCKQCHGDMTKETVAKVMTPEELNAIDENDIKFTRPTLTMGWCIECHGQKEIDIQSDGVSDYYKEIHDRLKGDKKTYTKYLEDDKITVAELGGWECAKCHY
jgi:mono/diheme cytochrome c family protein